MTKLDLEALEAKAKAATPGEWRKMVRRDGSLILSCGDPTKTHCQFDFEGRECDLDWIAAANPATMLALIERIRELEARLNIAEGLMNSDLEAQYEETIRSPKGTPNV